MTGKRRIWMPSATSIVARSYPDHIIGVDNRLPWHLGTDMRLFKKRTTGHAIIMGRRTYRSLGGPLPNRINIVLSRTEIKAENGVYWAKDPETALLLADSHSILLDNKQFFIIGGEEIYRIFDRFINHVWLTEVFCGRLNGDVKFEMDFDPKEWSFPYEKDFPETERDDHPFRISFIRRKKKKHRTRSKEEFLPVDASIREMLGEWAAKHTEPGLPEAKLSSDAQHLLIGIN